MEKVCINNVFLAKKDACIAIDNRSFRYGDGFFETMKVVNQAILFKDLHIQRIKNSFEILQLESELDLEQVFENILKLCEQNSCSNAARIRLTFSFGTGAIHVDKIATNYIIETSNLSSTLYSVNPVGLSTFIYRDAYKLLHPISNVKTASALVLAMAARAAVQNQKDEGIILNHHQHIIETTIANIYCIHKNEIYTAPLSEGCVDGVLRNILKTHIPIIEKVITEDFLKSADAVFISNTIRGVQWIQSIDEKQFVFPEIIHHINESILNRYIM